LMRENNGSLEQEEAMGQRESAGELEEVVRENQEQMSEVLQHEDLHQHAVASNAETSNPQPQEQHEPSAPPTPVPRQETVRLTIYPVMNDSQLRILDELERGVEILSLPQSLSQPNQPSHHEHAAAQLEEFSLPVIDAQAPVAPVPAPFSYPASGVSSRQLSPGLRLHQGINSFPAIPLSMVADSGLNPHEAQPQRGEAVSGLSHDNGDIYNDDTTTTSANENTSLTLSLRRSSLELRIDECIARLIEMGYADADGQDSLEVLRMYSTHAEGDVPTAIELLEEDADVWRSRKESELENDRAENDENIGERNAGEGWRLAGWY